jgi:hypothetical protein
LFLFSKKARAQRQQAAQQQAGLVELWGTYQNCKVLMMDRLPHMAQTAYPSLTDDEAERVAIIASNLMTAEPENPRALEGASSEVLSMAEALKCSAMKNSAELRNMAVAASQSLALFWLNKSWDPKSQTVNQTMLPTAERCIENAIEWGETKAIFLSTAVQINMSWSRFPRALELATKAVAIEPTNPEAVRMKGMAAYANGDLMAAKMLLEFARKLHPGLDGIDEPLRMIAAELRGA